MNELADWLDGQARKERRAVYLEEALLGNRFWAYAFYRLRYFFARYTVASLTHALTVLLLYRFFDRTHFVIVLVAYAVASVVSSFWWGSLEAMRTEVRRLYRLRVPQLIPKAIGRWLSLSLQLTLLTALGTVVWLAFHLLSGGTLSPAGLYVVAILLRLSLQFFTRAYHSGIYAIRRIYRPLPAILGVEFVGVVLAVALAPLLGAWALPVGALVGAPIVAVLSLYYTRRAYLFLGLSPVPFVTVMHLFLPPRRALRDFLGGGFSSALVSIDSLLVLVLFTTGRGIAGKTGLFALFFLLSPTLRAGSEWAQLLYFDLKRLEIRLFRNLRRRFERDVLRLAVVLGLFFSGVAALIGALVYRTSLGSLAWALVPFFVSLSLLAAVQIEAYSERAYPALIRNASLCLIGYIGAGLSTDDERTTVLLLATVSFGGFLLLALRRERLKSDGGHALLWPTEWLAELRSVDGSVRVSAAHFYADASTVEDDSWRQRQVGDRIARRLRRSGRATLIEPGLLAWYERADAGPVIGKQSVPSVSGGLLRWVGSCSAEGGLNALRAAAGAGLLGRGLAAVATRRTRPLEVAELRASFDRMFTSGIVYAPDEPIPAHLDALPRDEKRAAMVEAVAFARELRPRRSRSRFQVTAFCHAGELRLIFLVSRTAPRHLRSRWEALIRRHNLQAAMALRETETAHGGPRRFQSAAHLWSVLDSRLRWRRRLTVRVPEPERGSIEAS
jgi:hypothetical protein